VRAVNPHEEPLAELLAALEHEGEVPEAWLRAHAPDGRLDGVWARSNDGGFLLDLYAWTGDVAGTVRVACACARLTLHQVPASEPRPRRAVELAEAWARGEATEAAVLDAAYDAYDALEELGRPGKHDVFLAAQAALCAVDGCVPERYGRTWSSVPAAVAQALWLAEGHALPTPPERNARLADIVRGHLPCPTLEQLRAAPRNAVAEPT
jgi:hypothetical protein